MNKNFTAIILIVIAFGIYLTVTRPMLADAEIVKIKNDQLTSALNNAEEIIKSRNEVIQKYNSIPQSDRVKLDQMIPSSVDNIRLVIDLNNLALRNHFSLSNVKAYVPSNTSQVSGTQARSSGLTPPSTIPTSSGPLTVSQFVSEPILDRVEITFKATANYQEFIDFLRDVESSLRIMDLTRLGIKANDSGSYDFDVQFQTYWLRQ